MHLINITISIPTLLRRLNIYNQTKIETFSNHYFEIERGQKVAKKPNFFFEAKQEKKKPKSSYLASNRPTMYNFGRRVEATQILSHAL